ncbi:MAG TPA: hypothetical protein VND93_25350 [Myxococcales bacterium]|jgi:hypothetical protein|nr:hypothetical protein [Myxococcales bacterium]
MNALALAKSSNVAYAVQFGPSASLALIKMRPEVAVQLRRRLHEIAEVAGSLASVVADGVGSTLHLEVAGHVVSYVVSDFRRVLSVISVVPAEAEEPGLAEPA